MKVLDRKRATMLILLCCFTYALAYVGRLSYGANLASIIADFGITKSEGGMVSSFFFFSYAAGQLINTVMARYYKPKQVVACAMAISALCNLSVGLLDSIVVMRFVWLVNGLVQSTLWCSILNLQAKYLSRADVSRAIIWNCMTLGIGTFICYGLSALFSALGITWRAVFLVASVLLGAVSVLWYFGVRYTERAFHTFGAVLEEEQGSVASVSSEKPKIFTRYFVLVFVFACVTAACCAFVRDGVVTWLPTILIEDFGVASALSIILTMILPEISLFSAMMVKKLTKKIHGHLFLEMIFFLVATGMLTLIILMYPKRSTVITILCFALMYCAITAIVNLTTSIIPFSMRKYSGAVGGISAFLDACCYVGSICSTYGLGALAEAEGWMAVIYTAAGVCGAAAVIALVGSILARRTETTKNIL